MNNNFLNIAAIFFIVLVFALLILFSLMVPVKMTMETQGVGQGAAVFQEVSK